MALEPFKNFIFVSEVKFDLRNLRSYFEKDPWLTKEFDKEYCRYLELFRSSEDLKI